MCSNVGSTFFTTVVVKWSIYEQCGNHICSLIYVKYVYSAHHHVVHYSYFKYSMYMSIHLQYWPIKYLENLAYMSSLVGSFVSSIYMAIAYEVYIAVGCILSHVCKSVRYISPFSMLVV